MSTDSSQYITTDTYDLANYVSKIQQEHNEELSAETLMVGMNGMIAELFSNLLQNTVVTASEFSNESIPTRAKFEKNIIAHALSLNITDINATPATMDVLLTFTEDEIISHIGGGAGTFTFDCDSQIYFGDYEFHTDYDIIIKRVLLSNGSYTYTAMYDITGDDVYPNPVSDVTNPYLTPPVVIAVNGLNYLLVYCTLRQIEKSYQYKKVLSDNIISSKTLTFQYTNQLADFVVDVSNTSGDTHLIPVYEGLTNESSTYPYIWYLYLDTDNIRIKFDSDEYSPSINSDVTITLYTTQGADGNFEWSDDATLPIFSFSSDKHGYSNITVEVKPITGDSLYGTDRKSVEDLQTIIPVEALSRGSISTTTDLENYFNAIDTDSSKMYFYKKKDNCFERLYYSYIVMRDDLANVVPTNTVTLIVDPAYLSVDDSDSKLILREGQLIKLDSDGVTARIYDGEVTSYDDSFYYKIPYNFAICTSPMYGMFYLSTINQNNNLLFTYINEDCQYQYISTYINTNRPYIDNSDTYTITMKTEQNLTDDDSMVTVDEDGNITDTNIKAFLVLYSSAGEVYRWVEGSISSYDSDAKISTFAFTMTSEDFIDESNNIRIEGVNAIGDDGSILNYGYLPDNCDAMIHIVTKQPDYSTSKTYTDFNGTSNINLQDYIPTIDDEWCVTNSYEVVNGIDMFYDYSEIVYSTINVIEDSSYEAGYYYEIADVPMVKYDYFSSEDVVETFCGELVKRKAYIDEVLENIEDSFGMNFKFFNTYGPSRMFTIDGVDEYLNRVNLTLSFRISLQTNYDENIITYITDDILEYMNDIDSIDSIHMPNLVSQITSDYSDYIYYFEFLDMNGYGAGEQHIYSMGMGTSITTPELVNINTLADQTPDISITIA